MEERGSGEILLKTRAFGGFEKTQVLTYIDKLREENRQAEEALEGKLASISESRDALVSSIASFKAQIETLEVQLDEKRDKINELTGVINTMGGELARQKTAIAAKEESLRATEEANRQLAADAAAQADKAQRYQALSAEVGEIMIEARRSAGEIIRSAESASRHAQRDLIDTARRMADEMVDFRQDVAQIRDSVRQMADSLEERIDAVESVAADLQRRIAALLGEAEDRADEAPAAQPATARETGIQAPAAGEPEIPAQPEAKLPELYETPGSAQRPPVSRGPAVGSAAGRAEPPQKSGFFWRR